jgi:hypothetical protein
MSVIVKQQNSPSFSKSEASNALWRRANIAWKLDATQTKMYEAYKKSPRKVNTWVCSRRLGKSFALAIIAIETCLRKPNAIVKYLAPEQKQVRTILRPLFQEILMDCPDDLLPVYRKDDSIFKFKNGSEIQIAGCDNQQYESMRGGKADLCIVDEAGFVSELEYIIRSVLLPTTLSTGGRVILSSTPPRAADHDFAEHYVKEARFSGDLVLFTIDDCPRYTKQQVEDMAAEYGGRNSVEFRREFLCEFITDSNFQVVPEFDEQCRKECVKEWERPKFFDAYVSMDIGFDDLTFVVFAYWDFKKNKLIIEDELVMNGQRMTTDVLATAIKFKEANLWKDQYTLEPKAPYMRVSDNNKILINDLQQTYKLTFIATEKDDKDAALNNMRVMIKSGQVIINPRCKNLILHLQNATWNKSRKTYTRSPDAGHYDGVDALCYLCRNVQISKNPYPYGHQYGTESEWHYTKQYQDKKEPALLKLFKIRKR